MKESDFFKCKNGTYKRLINFELLLGLKMTCGHSMMMITMIFILVRWNSKKELKVLVKPQFWNLSVVVYDKIVTDKLLNKRDAFFFYINRMPYLESHMLSIKAFYFYRFWSSMHSLCEICPNTEIFLVRIFPHSNWIRRDTKYLSTREKVFVSFTGLLSIWKC